MRAKQTHNSLLCLAVIIYQSWRLACWQQPQGRKSQLSPQAQCTSYTSAAPARRSQLAAVTCQSKRLLLAGSNLQVASRSFQYRHGTQVRLRQLQLEGPAQTMFRGIVFCESPIVLQGKCKKPGLNETPLIKWSLIILRLTHVCFQGTLQRF